MELGKKSRRCILFARTANGQTQMGATLSVDGQIAALTTYAEQHAMTCVGQVRLDGRSRVEVEAQLNGLITRKREKDDFDTILAMSPDRLGRSIPTTFRLTTALEDVGIQILTADGSMQASMVGFDRLWDSTLLTSQPHVQSERQKRAAAARRKRAERLGQPLRVLGLARSATDAPAKVEAQVKSLHQFAIAAGMVWVDAVRLFGVGDKNIDTHVRSLIDRKRRADDFDTLLVADYSRLTRRGAAHLLRILRKLHRSGIRVISFLGDDHSVITPAFPVALRERKGVNSGS